MAEASKIIDPETGLTFIPIPITSLRIDTITDFDLYLPSQKDHAPVLYRDKNLAFTEETRKRLDQNNVKVLYVDARQEGAYRHYLERNLGQLLTDKAVDLDTKSTVLYTSARTLVKDVLTDPRSGNVIQRSADFVEHTTEFMLREKSALANLMKVTSYDYYTYTHSVNVFVYSVALAQRVDIDTALLRRYAMGALLHDIGKSEVDPAIINCSGKLSEEQWRIMKQHPVFGYDILREQGVTDEIVLDVTRNHHEKLNGKGYPDGLKGSEISELVRITTISDIFDALTTKRSYKTALRSFESLKLMREQMADELDQSLFRKFILMIGHPSD